LVVPSSGSTIHRCGLRRAFAPLSSARIAWSGKAPLSPDNRLLGFLVGLGNEIDRVGLAGDLDAA
jgi:hypothetical protein